MGYVDLPVLCRLCGGGRLKIKVYDWKKLLVSVLIGGIGLACALAGLFQGWGGISELLGVFIIGSLICRGVYESVTEQGFRSGKVRDERVKQVYRNRFGRFGRVMEWSPVITMLLLLLLAFASVPVWILITGLLLELLYMIWLTLVTRSD